ncbi:hypothetical protein [Flammeovirga aprica]|uniref:Uncharacterized protein n=1 Tax=Flammeovirga aprica JL-4 TaxID=694437 RepID=A0A7X9S1W3_9BACT|nr:hypothetical protein [Flammeovirga aprica]NME72833.1 hypothetical protein [Flammeovirga aprica JL-4]
MLAVCVIFCGISKHKLSALFLIFILSTYSKAALFDNTISLEANNKMKFLPFENLTYQTKLDSEEVLHRISDIIEPKKAIRITGIFGSSNHKPYEGSIEKNTFQMNRIINYRNSFLPIINGVVEKGKYGTEIKVKMKLHIFVMLFISIWLGIAAIASLALFPMLLMGNFDSISSLPFWMFVFGYVVVLGGFKYESRKSKKYLAELFEAKYIVN